MSSDFFTFLFSQLNFVAKNSCSLLFFAQTRIRNRYIMRARADPDHQFDRFVHALTFVTPTLKDQTMATSATAPTNKKTTHAPSASQATAMLRADHKRVSALFEEYQKARAATKKKDLVAQICSELTIQAQLEEEIFYPAVKQALKDHGLVPEATVEHATLKDLIAQVKDVEPDGDMFDAKIKVLSEYVKHHVKEEQNEMFPKAEATKLDMMALGARMAARKDELMAALA
jgi:hemerythrin superfamily protein